MTPSKQDSFGFLVADLYRLMRHTFRERLQGSTLTLAQGRVLVYVSLHEGVRQVDLAELLDVQPMTLARSIDQLEQDGLVERRAAPGDRRAYLIHLTPAAKPHLAAIGKVAASIRAQALRGLDPQGAAVALAALRLIRDNLRGDLRDNLGESATVAQQRPRSRSKERTAA